MRRGARDPDQLRCLRHAEEVARRRSRGVGAGCEQVALLDTNAEQLITYAHLQALIDAAGQNASEAARRAKMDRPYLLSLLRKNGLRRVEQG
jgi:ActR/RegA family two-component response regulator